MKNDEEEPFYKSLWGYILLFLPFFAAIIFLISPFFLWGLYKEYKAHNSNCLDCFTYCGALSHNQEYREKRGEVLLSIGSTIRRIASKSAVKLNNGLKDDETQASIKWETTKCKKECWETYGEEACSWYFEKP